MKLISMTDFVLEQVKLLKTQENNILQFRNNITNYANFLKQPLKLEMFVPCDEDGNIVSKFYNGKIDNKNKTFSKLSDEYQQAKNKVLFEGFELDETYKMDKKQLPYLNNGKASVFLHSDFAIRYQIIEDLIDTEITLTPNAIKHIFG